MNVIQKEKFQETKAASKARGINKDNRNSIFFPD
jgi:hypothetical protein